MLQNFFLLHVLLLKRKGILYIFQVYPKAKCIISSGFTNNPVMANYSKYGYKGVAVKPYTPQQLLKVLNQVLKINSYTDTIVQQRFTSYTSISGLLMTTFSYNLELMSNVRLTIGDSFDVRLYYTSVFKILELLKKSTGKNL